MLFQRFVEHDGMLHLIDLLPTMNALRIIEEKNHVRGGEGIEVTLRAVCQYIVKIGGGCPFSVLEAKFQQDRWADFLLLAPSDGLGNVFQHGNIHLVVLHG